MSAIEFELRKLLEDATFYIKNAVEDETYHEKSKNCLDRADQILLENTRSSFIELSAEAIVHLAEVSLLSGKRDEQAERILEIFFQRILQEDQYYCRALLAQATIEERKVAKLDMKGDQNLSQVQHAFSFVQRAIEICTRAENKQKYQFIVYNASIKTWHIVRGLMRPGWSKYIADILEKVSNLLEEADDSDFNWRCRYLNGLCKALKDGGKQPESLKTLDKLIELTKKKGECDFQEALFRTRMHMYRDNNGMLGNIKKETETGEDKFGFKALFTIQQIKSGAISEAQVEKELQMLMAQIAPASVSDDPAAAQQSQKITPIMQDRIAECGRMAIKYGLISYAEGACSTVARARQGSLRAKVLTEYTKAELLLRKPSADIDPKTGMKLNTLQRQIEDFEKRVEALKILDRAMIANKKLQDADVTIEGCILIWNIGIPLLKNSARVHIYKPFQAAATALEQLEANECQLRVCLHLELAKFEIEQDFLSRASLQLKKALMIDYSETTKNLPFELNENDNPDDFARPFDRALKFILKKLSLKTNLYGGDPDSMHELIILDVENAKTTKNAKMRETLLDKAIKQLLEYEEPEFEVRPEDNLVEQEIVTAQKKFHLNLVKERKERVLIAAEISKLALEEYLVDISFEAATLCVRDEWDFQKNPDLIIAQSQAHIVLAKVQVEYLLEEEIEIGHGELVTIEEDQDEREFTPEQKQKFTEQKQAFIDHIIQAVKLGQQVRQSWLVFNASIEFWNNYLPIFKLPSFYDKMHPQGNQAMLECFEAMNNSFQSAVFTPDAVDYELNKKMLVFTNLSVLLARYFEHKGDNNETVRVCDTLLVKQLPSHLRKTFDSIKARVTKQVSNLAQLSAAGGKKDAPAKGKNVAVEKEPSGPSKTELLTSEVLSYLELIQNGNKDMIQKAMDTMNGWQPNEQEEIELELNVELWCRLGRLAITQQTNAFFKVALYCADLAIKNGDEKAKARQYMQIPVTRLRWYAVAEALYGEALYLLLDRQKQEKESQDKLLHASVGHFVESCNIASKAGITYLVLESAKSMWNAIVGLLDAPNNRKLLIQPMALVHSYLSAVQENTDPDFLSLFYSALFQCIAEQRDWKKGEKITEEAFAYMPQTHHKVLWEAKMNFLSKLGKNVLSAISNMKESNASLMAKVWVRLARSSSNRLEQHSAYNKAIEILRKEESVEVVEVLIEYAEWMHRHCYDPQDVQDILLLAVDILMDIEPGWDDEDDELPGEQDEAKTKKTGRSGSSRQSRAMSKAQTRKSNAKSIKKSVAGKSRMSKATMRSRSMKSRASRTSKKTTTALQKRQEEDGQPLYMNCSHYDKMIRIHSMLAMLASDSQHQREYALDCHYFVIKMWEQSIFALNATTFMDAHKAELEQLGYSSEDQVSRRDFLAEIINGGEMQIPLEHALPEKPEDWIDYEIPQQYFAKSDQHEDKIMVAKYTFIKPELTFAHLQKLAKLLEQYYFHVQLLPVLQMLQLMARDVLQDPLAEKIYILKRARVLYNLGQKTQGEKLQRIAEENAYELTESERRVNYEKIKALKNPKDDMREGSVIPFTVEEQDEPRVLEMIRMHETWLAYSEELLKWGEFAKVKAFAKEVALHARILQDQDTYSRSLLILAQTAFIEGESAQSLKIFMQCQTYAKEIDLVERSIVETFNLLFRYDKLEDCERLLEPALSMLIGLRQDREIEHNTSAILETKSKNSGGSQHQTNLPLEFAVNTVLILQATLSIKLSQNTKLPKEDREDLLRQSFQQAEQFDQQMQVVGFRQEHICLLLNYTKLLWEEVQRSVVTDLESVQALKVKLQQCATLLLKAQEYVTNQVFYIGVHQESIKQLEISLPILRLLGLIKLRIAQVNTTIGVIKTAGQADGATGSSTERKQVDKVLASYMDQLTKQIQAMANTYKKNMNRYEKSISILTSALNLLHPHCQEYAEIQVEIAKNRRLLAMNKKHLRGQWRQDASQVDKVNMNNVELEEGEERKDQLEARGLEGEVTDRYVNYKNEMLRNFVELVQNSVGSDEGGQERSTLDRILEVIGESRVDNVLGTFATEFAEGRGNLNKEQAFYYLSLFQYAINRQQLQNTYLSVTTEKHPDVVNMRGQQLIRDQFSFCTSPSMPNVYSRLMKELKEQSKPYQIMKDVSTLEQMKENLPSSTGYLILQMADDQHSLYVAYCQVNKERQFKYYVSKLPMPLSKKSELQDMVQRLASMKTSMQKTPITIDEDLEALERESERELSSLLQQMEQFFAPVTEGIKGLLHPEVEVEVDENSAAASTVNQKAAAAAGKKEDPKKAAAKAAPKGGKVAPGQPAEVATFESNIPLTTGGIEAMVIMVDQTFETLPLEALSLLKKVPVVSRDFNLHLHMHRLKAVGHKAEMHNNFGINKEELRYIVDIPESKVLQDQGSAFVKDEMTKTMAGSKVEGIMTHSEHIPSEGEWQNSIANSSLFIYYSMTCLLHKFHSALISDLSIFNKCRAMIILDRMNSFKTLIDRNVLTSKHFSPDEQPMQQAALFTLCDVSTIVVNHWSTRPEDNLEQLTGLMRGALGEGLYLGNYALEKGLKMSARPTSKQSAAESKERLGSQMSASRTATALTSDEAPKLSIYKHNMVTIGVPFLRVQ